MRSIELFSGYILCEDGTVTSRFGRTIKPQVSKNGVLGRAKAALSEYRDQTFGTWRALVAGDFLLRGRDGLSVGMERRRLHGVGNSFLPVNAEVIGRAILASQALQGEAA